MCNTTTIVCILAACVIAYLWHMRSNGKRLINGVSNRMLMITVAVAVVGWIMWTKKNEQNGNSAENSKQ